MINHQAQARSKHFSLGQGDTPAPAAPARRGAGERRARRLEGEQQRPSPVASQKVKMHAAGGVFSGCTAARAALAQVLVVLLLLGCGRAQQLDDASNHKQSAVAGDFWDCFDRLLVITGL